MKITNLLKSQDTNRLANASKKYNRAVADEDIKPTYIHEIDFSGMKTEEGVILAKDDQQIKGILTYGEANGVYSGDYQTFFQAYEVGTAVDEWGNKMENEDIESILGPLEQFTIVQGLETFPGFNGTGKPLVDRLQKDCPDSLAYPTNQELRDYMQELGFKETGINIDKNDTPLLRLQ